MKVKLSCKTYKIYFGQLQSTRKRRKRNQPWWCEELDIKWKVMCEAETSWLSSQNIGEKRERNTQYVQKKKQVLENNRQGWYIPGKGKENTF